MNHAKWNDGSLLDPTVSNNMLTKVSKVSGAARDCSKPQHSTRLTDLKEIAELRAVDTLSTCISTCNALYTQFIAHTMQHLCNNYALHIAQLCSKCSTHRIFHGKIVQRALRACIVSWCITILVAIRIVGFVVHNRLCGIMHRTPVVQCRSGLRPLTPVFNFIF